MRLFIAINFTTDIRAVLINSIEKLKKQSNKGNFTRGENLHLTLAFIGETEDAESVKSVLDDTPFEKFKLTVSGSGKFKRDGGDIYWIGIEENKKLIEINKYLIRSLKNKGFQMERRRFTPHITIGREVICNENVNFSIPKMEMQVDRISLMKSERIDGKLTYTEIYSRR